MIQEITITPIGLKDSSIPLIVDFHDIKHKCRYLLTQHYKIVQDRDLTTSEKTFQINFTPQMLVYNLKWDDEVEKDKTDFVNVLKRHPLMQCEGYNNDNLTKPLFLLENKGQKKLSIVENIKAKGQVFNIINNLTVEEMRNISFWYGKNPTKMSVEDIYINLVDFQSGTLMAEPKEFILNYKSDSIQYHVVVQKALALDIIKKDNLTGMYSVERETIGKTIEDIILYCKSNKQMYEGYIRKEVIKQDNLPVGVDYTKKVGEVLGEAKSLKDTLKDVSIKTKEQEGTEEADALTKLRKEAKEAGIPFWQVKSYETLTSDFAKLKEATA